MNECVSSSADQSALDGEQVKWLFKCEKQAGGERTLFVYWPGCGSTSFEMFKLKKMGCLFTKTRNKTFKIFLKHNGK